MKKILQNLVASVVEIASAFSGIVLVLLVMYFIPGAVHAAFKVNQAGIDAFCAYIPAPTGPWLLDSLDLLVADKWLVLYEAKLAVQAALWLLRTRRL